MYCSHCGTKNEGGAKFCTSCGHKFIATIDSNLISKNTEIHKQVNVVTQSPKLNFFQKYIYRGDKRFFGSTLAIIVGVAAIGSSIQPSNINYTDPYVKGAGWAIILGALAYKSAKKTKLGIVKTSVLRHTLEILAVLIAVGFTLFNRYLWVALWVIIAYLVIKFKRTASQKTNE